MANSAAASANSVTNPWFSIVSLYSRYLRRCLTASGLTCRKIDIDDETTIQFWGPAADTSKPALVFLHGFGPEAAWQWWRQAAFFAADFAVYIPNLVFFGESTTKSPSERSEIFQAASIGKLMERLGVERYSVVGTSYGGFVAYRMAAMWPERVERLVIASSAVNMRNRDNEELLKRAKMEMIEELMLPATAAQVRALLGLAIFGRATKYVPHFFLNDVVARLYSEKRKDKLELLKGLTLGRDNTVNLLPLPQDVLIVWGDKDQIFLLEKANELKELLGEKAKLEVIKNTGHVPQIEDAGQFNSIVKNFLCVSS